MSVNTHAAEHHFVLAREAAQRDGNGAQKDLAIGLIHLAKAIATLEDGLERVQRDVSTIRTRQ